MRFKFRVQVVGVMYTSTTLEVFVTMRVGGFILGGGDRKLYVQEIHQNRENIEP